MCVVGNKKSTVMVDYLGGFIKITPLLYYRPYFLAGCNSPILVGARRYQKILNWFLSPLTIICSDSKSVKVYNCDVVNNKKLISFLRFEELLSNKIARLILPIVWMGAIFYLSSIPNLELQGQLAPLDFIFRRLVHVIEYAMLVILWSLTIVNYWIVIFLSGSYAVLDEMHQSFVPTRSGRPIDVMIDAVGIVLGIIMVKKLRNKRSTTI